MSGDAGGDPSADEPTDRRGVLDGEGVVLSATDRVTPAPRSVRSSREGKENVEPADAAAALEGVRDLDVATWNYASQDESVRHMGPMAEDFYDEFGLGADRERIATVDADGVAFGAIQALAAELDAKDDRLAQLARRLDELETENESLHARLAAVEERLEGVTAGDAD